MVAIILLLSAILIFVLKIQSKSTATEDANILKNLEELKSSHPEFSASQLKFYKDTAVKGSMMPCEGRVDENDCISSVAFIKDAYYFCGEIKDEKIRIKCSDAVLSKAEIDKCNSFNNDDSKTYCLVNIFFSTYKKPENCLSLKTKELQKICEGVIYFQMAIREENKELCNNIRDDYLENYCNWAMKTLK